MKHQLTKEEWKALETYAEEHGRTWKAQLREDWMNGRTSGTLQQLRNSPDFGPVGLIHYKRDHMDPVSREALRAITRGMFGL